MPYRTTWKIAAATLVLFASLGLGSGSATAQDGTPASVPAALDGATVALYAGSCGELPEDPLRDLGILQHQTVVPDPALRPPPRGESPPREILLTGEDINGNGVLDPGEDFNGNGTLDPGLLENEELVPDSALMISNVPEVWMLETPVEFDPLPPAGETQAIGVSYGSGSTDDMIACGDLPSNLEEEVDLGVNHPIFIDIAPIDGAGFRGFAIFPPADDTEGISVEVVMYQIPSPEAATATP